MPRPRWWILAVPILTALLLAGACSSAGDADLSAAASAESTAADRSATTSTTAAVSSGGFPGAEWQTVVAADAGMDQVVLDDVAAQAQLGESNCLVVTRDGKLVSEWYWNDTGPQSTQEVFSASKSFTSVLTGIASDDGDLVVQERASKWIPEWVGTPSEAVTVEELLNNTSGRYQSFESDYIRMAARAVDKTAFSIDLEQQSDPGTTWVYNNAAIQTLEAVISGATGEDLAEYAQERLFDPLGMADSGWARDRAGNPMTFMGVQSTCRDMARFGLLALNEGNWSGEQIVSEDWMEQSTGDSSQELNSAYGWLWWLNRPGTVLGADTAGGAPDSSDGSQLVGGAPEDMFFALGLGGQIIAVDPGTRTVVTRLGPSTYPPGTDRFTTEDAARVATEAVTGPTRR
jgi:CubicO group peptidase (beta-lactamase class C family)